jgi:hypothetical protein
MSRRSILLATTFYIAIGSFAAVGPVSAHGFGPGGFNGGPSGPALAGRSPTAPGVSNVRQTPVQPMNNLGGGTKLDHVPSIATPPAQGNISGPRIEPTRIPAVTNATIPNSPAVMQSPRPRATIADDHLVRHRVASAGRCGRHRHRAASE